MWETDNREHKVWNVIVRRQQTAIEITKQLSDSDKHFPWANSAGSFQFAIPFDTATKK